MGKRAKMTMIQRNGTHQGRGIARTRQVRGVIHKTTQMRLAPLSVGPCAQDKLVPNSIDTHGGPERTRAFTTKMQKANHFTKQRPEVSRFLGAELRNFGFEHWSTTQYILKQRSFICDQRGGTHRQYARIEPVGQMMLQKLLTRKRALERATHPRVS